MSVLVVSDAHVSGLFLFSWFCLLFCLVWLITGCLGFGVSGRGVVGCLFGVGGGCLVCARVGVGFVCVVGVVVGLLVCSAANGLWGWVFARGGWVLVWCFWARCGGWPVFLLCAGGCACVL